MKNPQALCYNKFRLRTGDFLCAKVRNMCWKTGGSYMEKKKKSMKLRTRVIISFFIIILVPIVMCALTFYFFVGYKAKIIGEKYGLANATYRTISNNTLLLNAMTSEEYDEVEDTAKSDTAKLEETNYLSVLNARLQKKQSFIAVREDGVIIYNGSEELSSEELENELPKYGDPGANLKGGVYFRNEKQWMVKQADYENSDGKECSAFIVTKTDQIAPQITGMVKELGIVIVLILVLTSLGLSFWIYRGVIGPLEQLKKATQNIKDGNLDFTVEPCGVAEINDLCEDFEEMRIRLKETAEEKVEFDKENKELISNISHDLKTPITAVKGYVEGIMDGVANTPEKMDRYIRTIYNKANEMDRLINELTFYSKIDTNRIPYTFSKIHIADYFDDCVEELNLELDAQHVDLTYFNYLEDDPVVIADAEQIKRVINNIVSNSIKYMDKSHKVINIRLRDVGDFVQVEIEDNGKGIATKDLTKIFDRFYRTDASRNSTRGGSGIGLSIVKKILEDHGHGIGLQLGGNIAEVIGLDVQLAERAFEYPACLVERGFNLVVLLAEEECVEPFLVAFIFFGTDLCKTGLRIVILVDSVICTVCPEHEVVGLRGYQTQIIECNLLVAYRLHDTVVKLVAVVDFQNTAVDRGPFAEIIGHGTALHSALRNTHRKRRRRPRIRCGHLVLLTCGKCCQHSR